MKTLQVVTNPAKWCISRNSQYVPKLPINIPKCRPNPIISNPLSALTPMPFEMLLSLNNIITTQSQVVPADIKAKVITKEKLVDILAR